MKTSFLSKLGLGLSLSLTLHVAVAGGLDQFKNFVASTKSAKGEFTQLILKLPNGAVVRARPVTGYFVFARPGKFIWHYQVPYEQLLQADGEKLYIYDKDLNQVTVKKLGEALSASPAAILFGSNEVEKNFNLKEMGRREGLDWLELTPKAADSTFAKIEIGLKQGMPQEMILRDAFGQITQLQLQKIEKNPKLGEDSFKFAMPKGVDVFGQ